MRNIDKVGNVIENAIEIKERADNLKMLVGVGITIFAVAFGLKMAIKGLKGKEIRP